MNNHRSPDDFKKFISSDKNEKIDVSELKKAQLEIKEILNGLDKGLKVLAKLGRPPDKKVLDNQKKFQELKQKITDLIALE